ncbi:hypothetical protein LPB72_07580 [Hydrogenophaga crassostreae]|uniref:Uncharacterized protein n=2 Tax=Hydrogenophaga crassostreae TaxID=1763535 RepID=A0A162W0U2_9BURK|nr:hypothetical protein LPB072_09790 [Hydrogenophaga crassostreae]OAD42755.1 hypothetical protein LPB72_07580 [Hydrogenophaga crassostreae]
MRDASRRGDQHAMLLWPDDLLTLFSLRMSSHGMSISRIDMRCDTQYALQQLHDAQDMGDRALALIADELFCWFKARQSGLSGHPH